MSICAILVPTSFFSGHYLLFFRTVIDGMVGCLQKIAATQPLAYPNFDINLIEHEPVFLPITLQSRSHHEQTPQATALAQTITGVELQIPSHNGTPIKLTIDQIDNYSLIELLRGLQ